MERGFKTWAEKYAVDARQRMGLEASSPLDPRTFAETLGVRVYGPGDIPGISEADLAILLRNDGATKTCWSAVTVQSNNKIAVILNTSHPRRRQSSDLMHELAHQIRGHRPHDVEVSSELLFLDNYDREQEDEANWLSGALLLPRAALLRIKTSRLTTDEACDLYQVSESMLNYRVRMTGIKRQFSTRSPAF